MRIEWQNTHSCPSSTLNLLSVLSYPINFHRKTLHTPGNQLSESNKLRILILLLLSVVEIRLFYLTGHFWCWYKSHCSWPIATKGFGGVVISLFCPVFAGSFSHFSYKEVPNLQEINLSALILFNIFLRKYRRPLSSCSQHSWNRKQNKVGVFAKPTLQDVTQCYRTQTHYKI